MKMTIWNNPHIAYLSEIETDLEDRSLLNDVLGFIELHATFDTDVFFKTHSVQFSWGDIVGYQREYVMDPDAKKVVYASIPERQHELCVFHEDIPDVAYISEGSWTGVGCYTAAFDDVILHEPQLHQVLAIISKHSALVNDVPLD